MEVAEELGLDLLQRLGLARDEPRHAELEEVAEEKESSSQRDRGDHPAQTRPVEAEPLQGVAGAAPDDEAHSGQGDDDHGQLVGADDEQQ